MDGDLPLWTLAIVITTAVVTILAFRNLALREQLLLHVEAIAHKREWWRIFTSALVHADWVHLGVNLISLFAFGSFLEFAMPPWQFGLLYITGVGVASFVSYLVHRHQWSYRALGASGGVCAVVGAATAAFPEMTMMIFPIPFPMPAWIVGTGFIVYSVVGAKGQWDNVGHDAHLAGTLAGIGLLAALYPRAVASNALEVGVMLAAGGLAWLFVRRR